ncbi:MAG: sigma-70 family RNA polymerase sigma factor [Taibaiella sp.]|nr:sigma-70 family RNA polymerase sigma factor [Taibaiella sp.]
MLAQSTYTEQELILLLQQRSKEAFNYLYKNYCAVLLGVIVKVVYDQETANDVLQETFVKIWNNINQYNPQKGRIYTWMLNIARNSAIDKLRSKGEIMKSKIQMGDDAVNNIQNRNNVEQVTDTIGLRKVVSTLKPEYEIIINLAYFKGFTLDEISKTLNIPLGTVKTRMRSAIQQLRAVYNN